MNKHSLRKQLLASRAALMPEAVSALSLAAQKHVLAQDIWKKARQVALYTALGNETDTTFLLRQAWRDRKDVLLPRVDPERRGEMSLCPCLGEHELLKGTFGVREPDPLCCPPRHPEDPDFNLDLIIIPGVGFDLKGNRIGFGAGYYDRYLSHPALKSIPRIGLAYSLQIVADLPTDPWDIRMNVLCTEEECIWL